jgi:hypothetical protein
VLENCIAAVDAIALESVEHFASEDLPVEVAVQAVVDLAHVSETS